MAIWAIVEGNLAKNPERKTVKVDGEDRELVNLLVFSDVGRKVDGQWVQNEDKSGLLEATIWTEKLGEVVFTHLRKGARVQVQGDLHLQRYVDSAGKPEAILRMNADDVTLKLFRIESIAFKAPQRRERLGEPAGA